MNAEVAPVPESQQKAPSRRPAQEHRPQALVNEVVQYLKTNGGNTPDNIKAVEAKWGVQPTTAKRWLKNDGVRLKNGARPLLESADETVLFKTIDKLNHRGDPVNTKTIRQLVWFRVFNDSSITLRYL